MSDLLSNPGIEIRDAQRELTEFRFRLAFLAGFVLLMFVILAVRFAHLQITRHEHYDTLAEANRISILPLTPSRGVITDRNGVVLARNYSAHTLEITPSRAGDVETVIEALSGIVEITPRDLRRFNKLREESKRFESLPIRTRLSDEE